ncbi:MAG: glutaredoxin family protein [Acidimicrobiia bacterium]
MSDIALRILLVAVGAIIVGLGTVGARKHRQPVHPAVDLSGTGLPTGVVLFTSTDCSGCDEARRALGAAGIDYREVTWELEGRLLEDAGVEAVPLAVFRDETGATVAQIAGAPRGRSVARAVAALAT